MLYDLHNANMGNQARIPDLQFSLKSLIMCVSGMRLVQNHF